jgi:hypothetical protein
MMVEIVERPTAHNPQAQSHQGRAVRRHCLIVYGRIPALQLLAAQLIRRIEMTLFLSGALSL